MQFVVRSPLTSSDCTSRLASALEGPVPSLKTAMTGWHVFGESESGHLEATLVGTKVEPDGRKLRSLRPVLKADLTKGTNETILTGQILNRYGARRGLANSALGPMVLAGVAVWALMSISTMWPLLILDAATSALVAYTWLARSGLIAIANANESELLSWLERTVDGKRD